MNRTEILATLKNQISPQEYNQYLSKISFDEQHSSESKIIFLADNLFLLNWVKRNYKENIQNILGKDSKVEIIFRLKSESNLTEESKNNSQKKYIMKNNQSMTNTECRFDNFIVGECNRFAYETAREVVQYRARYNPLLIHGNTGLGKTHLLNAICNAVYRKNPNAMIVYITAETMFNEYRHRLHNRTMDQFRERFRKCDYLLIDDVQFLAKTEKFQEEFFNTFNEIINVNGQIVMTSDKPPKLIEKLEKRLKSRFSGGMTAKIESPELETKINIVKQKCQQNDIMLDSEIINLLATQIHDNIREIEGIIVNLYAHMSILKMPITLETVKHVLKDREIEKHEITFDDIVKIVAIEYNIKPSEIKTKVRGKKNTAKARKIVTYIARNQIHATFPSIAAELNLKDHSAVSKQIKSITDELQQDPHLKMEIENMISKLKLSNP
ncbi:chromosomal replication initiator protein DnaA [Helicobacter didelphidarum]|uniref:Chromosomal replication initiator protein DnaA n=1 Tax=Helicobacter didelphidarum TaxID=2040648 RepID=A0A3D8ILC3_9HELI|nr:chromosomal replication initiator protein DnaA [Helicobacter didelphidarum]